jgi:hypothetical protein
MLERHLTAARSVGCRRLSGGGDQPVANSVPNTFVSEFDLRCLLPRMGPSNSSPARGALEGASHSSVVGPDPNPGMLAVAAARADVAWRQGQQSRCPAPDQSFDKSPQGRSRGLSRGLAIET